VCSNALFLYGHHRDAVISGNEFVWTGDNAIVLQGESAGVSGIAQTHPMRTLISGNLIHELGIFCKQTSAIFQAITSQTTIRGNVSVHASVAFVIKSVSYRCCLMVRVPASTSTVRCR
jgi:hypothetical protein